MNLTTFTQKAANFHVLGIKVTQNGKLTAQWESDYECRRNIYSATKSFTSCAVGFAIQEGLLALDEKLTDAFPNDLPGNLNENLKKATVRDLLTMCLGQERPALMGEQRPVYEEDDWVKMSLAIPFCYEPGTHFVYNNVGPYLGIKRPTWETDPLGNTFGAGGLFLTLTELHKFGLFYLNKGNWNGKQLLNEKWMEESTRQQVDAPYGYLFWRGEYNSYRADGKYSQLSIILPDQNAVVSVVSECRRSEELLRVLYDDVIAQL